MNYLKSFFERIKLANMVRCAKENYKEAAEKTNLEPRVSFCPFGPPVESIPTKPGELSENQINLRIKSERQNYSHQKYIAWEEISKTDIESAKTKWQRFWALRRAPKCLRKEYKKTNNISK